MTLLTLARAWINKSFDSEIFIINSKKIIATQIKGTILVRMNLTANDCLYIASGTTFDVDFRLMYTDNVLSNMTIEADSLSAFEMQEMQEMHLPALT